MSQYRIYLSVRRADTGKQVADITAVPFLVPELVAENCVERMTADAGELYAPMVQHFKAGMAEFWPNVDLLYVFMKELVVDQKNWLDGVAPGTKATLMQVKIVRSLEKACRAVDKEIEASGAVSAETIDLVRSALFLIDK